MLQNEDASNYPGGTDAEGRSPLSLKPFRQSESFCGPASLKILLSHFEDEYTENELAALVGATRDEGTDHLGLMRGATALGFHVFAKDHGTIDELRNFVDTKRVPVIVGWWQTDGDHYSVVYRVSKDFIYLMDPSEECGSIKLKISSFLPIWYDFSVTNGVEKRYTRWFLAAQRL